MKNILCTKLISTVLVTFIVFGCLSFFETKILAEETTYIEDTTVAETITVESKESTTADNSPLQTIKMQYILYPGQRITPNLDLIKEYTGNISYSSNKPDIAKFKDGDIIAKSKGRATLSVQTDEYLIKIKIKVKKGLKKITFTQNNICLNKGDKRFIHVNIMRKRSKEPVVWKSSNKKIVTVNKNGRITGKKKGTAYITCSSKFTKKSDKIKVTVKNTRYIAFTFDDGPGPYTNDLLETLSNYDSKATFFVVGNRLNNYASILSKEYSFGHEIGNHSYDHANLAKLTFDEVEEEFDKTDDLILEYTDNNSTLIRPPYGSYNKNVLKASNVPIILWSVDTLDWKYRNSEYVKDTILSHAADGKIVLLHDIHKTSVEGFKKAIKSLKNQGYELVTVSELYRIKGIKMHPKKTYFGC